MAYHFIKDLQTIMLHHATFQENIQGWICFQRNAKMLWLENTRQTLEEVRKY